MPAFSDTPIRTEAIKQAGVAGTPLTKPNALHLCDLPSSFA